MSNLMDDRVLALAGLLQTIQQVRRIAETGQSDNQVVTTAMESIFRIDAPSTVAVYGDYSNLKVGLRLLKQHLSGDAKDPDALKAITKIAWTLFALERRFMEQTQMVSTVTNRIILLTGQAEQLGHTHPDTFQALGKLYSDTLSELRPRIMVQGNPHYLNQASVINEIRALLLAAIRSTVLWRQLEGNVWHAIFLKKSMLNSIENVLQKI